MRDKLEVGKLKHERYLVLFKYLATGFAALGAAAFFTPFADEPPFGIKRPLILAVAFVGLLGVAILFIKSCNKLDKQLGWQEEIQNITKSKLTTLNKS